MSDERTLREDLIIREGSSPEAKRGKINLFFKQKQFFSYFVYSDATDNEDELRITESGYDAYKVTPHVGRAPIFLQSLMPMISKAGDIVTLKCSCTATPMPSATWLELKL